MRRSICRRAGTWLGLATLAIIGGCSSGPPITEITVAGIRLEDSDLRARRGEPALYDFFVRPGPPGRWEFLVLPPWHSGAWESATIFRDRAEANASIWEAPIPRMAIDLEPSNQRAKSLPDYSPPRSFMLDPVANTATATNPADWITDDPANPRPRNATYSFEQSRWPIANWMPVLGRGGDRFIIDRSRRFYARVTHGPSAGTAFGTRDFRFADQLVCNYVFFYDVESDERVGNAVRLEPGRWRAFHLEPLFTHDSRYVICFAHDIDAWNPHSLIWIIPTGLPTPEEPWTPPQRTKPRRVPPPPITPKGAWHRLDPVPLSSCLHDLSVGVERPARGRAGPRV